MMKRKIIVSPYIYPLLPYKEREAVYRNLSAVDYIVFKALSFYGVSLDDMRSKSRLHKLSECRQVVCKLLRTQTHLSLKQIGEKIGNRDHTTVLYCLESMDAHLLTEKAFRERYEELLKTI